MTPKRHKTKAKQQVEPASDADKLACDIADRVCEAIGVPLAKVVYPPNIERLLAQKYLAVKTDCPRPNSVEAVVAARFDRKIAAACREAGLPLPDGVTDQE